MFIVTAFPLYDGNTAERSGFEAKAVTPLTEARTLTEFIPAEQEL